MLLNGSNRVWRKREWRERKRGREGEEKRRRKMKEGKSRGEEYK